MQTHPAGSQRSLRPPPRIIVGQDGCLAHRILCIMSRLSLPEVATIIARSRDYHCPHFFCQASNPAFHKGLRVPFGIMHA
jgi:hypothetical protein